jgi:hypothetical protein
MITRIPFKFHTLAVLLLCASASASAASAFAPYKFRVSQPGLKSSEPVPTTPPPAASDPYFANVGLLMHFDSAGGPVKDHSPVPVTGGTMIGNPTLSNAAYYSNGASLATGTNSYVSMPWKSSYSLAGSYTVEAWVNLSAVPPADPGGDTCATIVAAGVGAGNAGWALYVCTNTSLVGIGRMGLGSVQVQGTYRVPLRQWTHIAAVQDGSASALYVNGVSIPLKLNAFTGLTVSNGPLTIGSERRYSGWDHDFPGYIDELRITNGVARYKGNFTPSPVAYPDN